MVQDALVNWFWQIDNRMTHEIGESIMDPTLTPPAILDMTEVMNSLVCKSASLMNSNDLIDNSLK